MICAVYSETARRSYARAHANILNSEFIFILEKVFFFAVASTKPTSTAGVQQCVLGYSSATTMNSICTFLYFTELSADLKVYSSQKWLEIFRALSSYTREIHFPNDGRGRFARGGPLSFDAFSGGSGCSSGSGDRLVSFRLQRFQFFVVFFDFANVEEIA